jgi:hypothetical protein
MTQSPISEFRDEERWHFSDLDQNRFAMALAQIDRYYNFLRTILNRLNVSTVSMVALNSEYMKNMKPGTHAVTVEEAQLLDKMSSLQVLIQLDIESYYIFGKIILDKTSNFIELFFGSQRGCTLRSHDNLVKSIKRYCADKGLLLPANFIELATIAKSTISDYRDKQIEHHNNSRRIMGISMSVEGITLAPGHFYPKETDHNAIMSTPIKQVMKLLDDYIGTFTELIRANRGKGKFELKEKTNA